LWYIPLAVVFRSRAIHSINRLAFVPNLFILPIRPIVIFSLFICVTVITPPAVCAAVPTGNTNAGECVVIRDVVRPGATHNKPSLGPYLNPGPSGCEAQCYDIKTYGGMEALVHQ